MEIRPKNFDYVSCQIWRQVTLDVFARFGVRRFHTIDALCSIEFFMKYVLKAWHCYLILGTQVMQRRSLPLLTYAPWRGRECSHKKSYIYDNVANLPLYIKC